MALPSLELFKNPKVDQGQPEVNRANHSKPKVNKGKPKASMGDLGEHGRPRGRKRYLLSSSELFVPSGALDDEGNPVLAVPEINLQDLQGDMDKYLHDDQELDKVYKHKGQDIWDRKK